ncbi:MAG: hypothetical protein ACUVS3_00450 [Thermodesulfobacteriota bacterium]
MSNTSSETVAYGPEFLERMRQWLVACGNFRLLGSPADDIYPFASPLVLSVERHLLVSDAVSKICTALEKLASKLASDKKLAREVLLLKSPLEEEFFFQEHGLGSPLPVRRLDMVLDGQGLPRLLEVNCGCPGGELDPALVAEAHLKASGGKLPSDVQFLDPRQESLDTLLSCYREFRKTRPELPEVPRVTLLTSKAQASFMIPECRGIAQYYRAKGIQTVVGQLEDLRPARECLTVGGEPVSLVFRKFSTESFRRRLENPNVYGTEAIGARILWEAVSEGKLCLVNPLGSTLLQDKGLLEALRREFRELKDIVPQTFIIEPRLKSTEPELWETIRSGEAFVLKRRLSYGGRHVILDPQSVSREAPRLMQDEPGAWVAQERVCMGKEMFSVWEPTGIKRGELPFVLSPFGRSAFVRVGLDPSSRGPINAHRGSATGFVLVRETRTGSTDKRSGVDEGRGFNGDPSWSLES